MQHATQWTSSKWSQQTRAFARLLAALCLLPVTVVAGNPASTATSQISTEAANDRVIPPNAVTGPDFRLLMQMMRRNIVRCGVPRTAVLRFYVLPDGVLSDFVLHQSSGDACFDEIAILNAEQVVQAKLRITPATRNGVAEAAWVPVSVAARD